MSQKINWDALGIVTSLACAVHCALLPLFLTSLPLFGINIIENQGFEYGMVLLAFAIGGYSLYHGKKKHHASWMPTLLFTVGILMLLAKIAWHEWQLWLLVPAVCSIIAAHTLNYLLYRGQQKKKDFVR